VYLSSFARAVAAISLGSVMVFANLYLAQPLLPALAEEFGLSPQAAYWAFTASTLALGAALLVHGSLSDCYGRRRLMLISLAAVGGISVALCWAQTFWQLVLLRALLGGFLAGLPATAIAYLADEFSAEQVVKGVGIYIGANSVGGIGGRLLAGMLLEQGGWHASFVGMAWLNGVILLLVWWLLPAAKAVMKPDGKRHSSVFRDIVELWRNPRLAPVFLIGGLNFMIFVNQSSFAIYRFTDAPYHFSIGQASLLFLSYLAGTFSSSQIGLARRWLSGPQSMALGICLMMAGSLLTLNSEVALICAGFVVSSIGFFFCHANCSAWVSQQTRASRGKASAVYLVCYYLGASLGGYYLGGFWNQWGWQGVVAGSLLALLMTLGLAGILTRTSSRVLQPG